MSAQLRYRTVVNNMGRIYTASNEERTNLLQAALNEIATVVAPRTAEEWNVVGADSERVLRVWVAREDNEVAREMAKQLVDLMYELAAAPVPPSVMPVTPPVFSDKVEHVDDARPTLIIKEEEAEEEEAEEEEVEVEVEIEDNVSKEDSEAPETDVEMSDAHESESESESEVVEPEEAEEEEEEEAAMEVEQIHIRGRAYWLETNTKKLYAVIGDDDVGDEVGAMVNGKPQFLAKGA